MPANLTPMYHKAERTYRQATTPAEQLACLEEMFTLLPKHKGTDKLQADLKKKMKETRAEVAAASKSRSSSRVQRVPRQGCAQVVVIGGPNAGKSQLVASLTNATPEVAPYPYTTRSFTPGMMPFEDVVVQLVDTPPIAVGSIDVSLLNLIRVADLVLLCVDGSDDDGVEQAAIAVAELDARKTRLSTESGFVDGLTTLGLNSRVVLTRANDPDAVARLELFRELTDLTIPVIAFDSTDQATKDDAKSAVFNALGLIRVYTKRPGQPAERTDPFTLPEGALVEDVATKVHQELAAKLRSARVWNAAGQGGQTVGREHPVQDGDTVELHT